MKYGINLLLWTDRMHDGLMPVLEQVKAMGYEGVEMPMFELNEPLYADWGKRLDGLALERTAVTIRGAGDNPISPSAGVRAAAVDAMKKTVDCCQAAGVSLLAGPTHSAIGGPCSFWENENGVAFIHFLLDFLQIPGAIVSSVNVFHVTDKCSE